MKQMTTWILIKFPTNRTCTGGVSKPVRLSRRPAIQLQNHWHSSYKCRMKKKKTGAWVSGRNETVVKYVRWRYLTESVLSRGNTSDVFGVFRVQISAHILSRPRWRSWFRHRYKPKGRGFYVIGIFHWHNPSGRTMALGSIQPLT